MRSFLLVLLLPSLLAVGGCKASGGVGDLVGPGFAVVGYEEADLSMTGTNRPVALRATAAAEEDMVAVLKQCHAFDGYRVVAKERSADIFTGPAFPEYVLWTSSSYGRTAAAGPSMTPRLGEVLLDLSVTPAYDSDSFHATFELAVRGSSGVLGTHAVKLRAELRGGRFREEVPLASAARDGFDRMRAVAIRLLVRRLLDDPITLDAIEAEGRARTPAAIEAERNRPKAPPPAPAAAKPRLPAPQATKGRTFVLAVGIDDYADPAITDLRAAVNDARDAAAFYALHRRSPAGPERVVTLLGAAATRASVLAAVREHLGQATDAEDAVVLYFAGHGFTDSHDAYLATADTELARLPETAIAMSQLRGYWDRLGAASKLVLVDACHAGALAGLRGVGGIARPKDDPAATRPLGDKTIVVAASAPEQLSAEHGSLARGVFTTALLHGLAGDADQDGDRVVTLGEMRAFLEAEVPRRARIAGARQTPVVVAPAGADATALTR